MMAIIDPMMPKPNTYSCRVNLASNAFTSTARINP